MSTRADIQLKLPAIQPKTIISELKAAQIMEVDERGHYTGGMTVDCMFNPYEYTLSKSNTYTPYDSANGSNSPKAELTQSGAHTLQLELFFDTTQIADESRRNVTLVTNELWKFMSVKEALANQKKVNPQLKAEAPLVAFH